MPRAVGAAVAVIVPGRRHRPRRLHAQRRGDGHRQQRPAGGAADPRSASARTAASRGGALQQVQQAANEIDKAAAGGVDGASRQPTRAARDPTHGTGVQKVEVVEPPFRAVRLPLVRRHGPSRVRRAVRADPLPRLLPARHRRSLQAQARQDRRPDALAEEDHGADPRRDQPADRELHRACRCSPACSSPSRPALALWWFGVEHFVVWGLLAGIFNSIPYLGPDPRHRRPGVVAFMQFDDVAKTALRLRRWRSRITSLEGFLLTPMLMGRAAQMNPGRDLRRPALLELDLGRLGHRARGADADDAQGHLRSRRGSAADRRAAGRVIQRAAARPLALGRSEVH